MEDTERMGRDTGVPASSREGWRPAPRSIVGILAAVLLVVDLYLIFAVAPTDANLGNVQRALYIHVPIAVLSLLAFIVVFVGSVMYLRTRNNRWDNMAVASGEVGFVFVSLALLTGILWAKPVWNVWWTWEPRLTLTLVLWFIYAGYLMVRAFSPDRNRGAVFSAIVGIIGSVDAFIVYFAVQWWRSIHPPQVVGPWAESGSLSGTMNMVLMVSLIAFLVLTIWLVLERVASLGVEDDLGRLRFELRRAGRSAEV